jgi:hypothetical protein
MGQLSDGTGRQESELFLESKCRCLAVRDPAILLKGTRTVLGVKIHVVPELVVTDGIGNTFSPSLTTQADRDTLLNMNVAGSGAM